MILHARFISGSCSLGTVVSRQDGFPTIASRKDVKVNELNDFKTMAPVTLLLLLVIAAMGVMVFWGLSLLDLSE